MQDLVAKKVLVVTAQPGELEWLFGGTIYQLSCKNHVVHVIATCGEKGTSDPEADEAEVAAVRRREQLASAEITGVRETIFFGLPDGDLAYGSLPTLRLRLYRAMRTYQPQVLITFDPESRYDPHPDHGAVARLAFEAANLHSRMNYFPEKAPAHQAELERCLFFAANPSSEPYKVNDVTEGYPQRLAALRCHASQTAARWKEIQADLDAAAAVYGKEIGARFGEPYRELALRQRIEPHRNKARSNRDAPPNFPARLRNGGSVFFFIGSGTRPPRRSAPIAPWNSRLRASVKRYRRR